MGSSKRFGVKKKGREIEEWFFATSKKNAGFLGATGSDSHLTWLEDKEEDEISIHLTDQITGEHRFLGRISKHMDEAELIIYSARVSPRNGSKGIELKSYPLYTW